MMVKVAAAMSAIFGTSASCPLYPRKRTFAVQLGMSAFCQKRTLPTSFARSFGLLDNHRPARGRPVIRLRLLSAVLG